MRGLYSTTRFAKRDRTLEAEAPASPVMQMPPPSRDEANTTTHKPKYKPLPHVIVMRKREDRLDGVEVWGPEAA
jgi:hypothetical protein